MVVVGIGIVLLVASLLLMSFLVGFSPWLVSGGLLLTYIGFTLIQTGLINSVSQTLDMQQTGVGMGLFNLITFISAAIGTALVARVLASGWLDRKLNPLILGSKAFAYSNLMVVFAVLIALGGKRQSGRGGVLSRWGRARDSSKLSLGCYETRMHRKIETIIIDGGQAGLATSYHLI